MYRVVWYCIAVYYNKAVRRQGRQRKRWEDNTSEWTGLEFPKSRRAVENREKWMKLVVKGGGVAQLEERRTGTPLRQVRYPDAARDFPPRVNSQCRLSYGVRTALVCNRTLQHLCDMLKSQSIGSPTFVWTQENTARTVRSG